MASTPIPAGASGIEVAPIVATFRERWLAGAPFAQDRALADELAMEVSPVIHALAFALGGHRPEDVLASEHREGLAMLSLLGRRVGALGATPTAALAILPALIAGFERAGHPIPVAIHEPLRAVCFEGYVAGREDRSAHEFAMRAIEAQPIVRLVPGCVALFVGGEHEAEALAEVVDRFGRELFAASAKAAIVHLERLEGPDRSRAAEIFGADATARLLGATCVFSAASHEWLEAARAAQVPIDLFTFEPSFEAAARRALGFAGYELATTRSLAERLRDVFVGRPGMPKPRPKKK